MTFNKCSSQQKNLTNKSHNFIAQQRIPDQVKKILVVGDFQQTAFLEKIIGREDNRQFQPFLIEMMKHENADIIIFNGDLTFDASLDQNWQYFSMLIQPLTDKPAYATVGNHELWNNELLSKKNLYSKFPNLASSHYFTIDLPWLTILLIDTNVVQHNSAAQRRQSEWLKAEVGKLTKPTIVLGHHPPFTNSKLFDDNKAVKTNIVPLLYNSPEVKAYISGHVHSYERFLKNKIHFIVSGGGGGPRVRLLDGQRRRHEEAFDFNDSLNEDEKRPLHYLVIEHKKDKILFRAVGFHRLKKIPTIIDEFTLD